MAKRSNRCSLRYEKDQSGCMWGLISMLDFRHSRSTQRLLSNRRRDNRNAVGNKLEMLTSSANNCPGPLDGEEERTAIDACKPSMKKLLEGEMSGEKVAKKEANNTEVEAKQFDNGQGDDGKKNRKRKNKTCKKSSGSSPDMDVAENLVVERSCQHKPEQETTSNLDIDNLMEEFFQKIHQKRINCMNHDQLEVNPTSYSFDERLSEAIKFLVSQKRLNEDQLTEDGEVRASKEVMDALEVLSLDEDFFPKILRDPNSLLLKYIQDLSDAHLKGEESKPLAESNFSDSESVSLRQHNWPVNRKHLTFFRRKPKSQERDLSDGNKASQASNKIVILKPGSTCLQTPETVSNVGSSSESRDIISHQESNEKVSSHFFLSEIKRKLKHAIGRDQHRIPTDGISKRFPSAQQNLGETRGVKEYLGMNSPTKDHFFIERIAKPSIDVAKGENMSQLKGSELGTEYETTDLSRQRVSVYIEAKKHLSELLANEDENVDLSSTQVPKTLGRILSLPEYNSSPVGSPRPYLEHSTMTEQTIFIGSDKFGKVSEDNELYLVSNLSQMADKTNSGLCIPENQNGNEVEGDNAISNNLDTCVNNDKEDPNFCFTKDEMKSKDSVSVKETEIVVHEESRHLDASSYTNDYSITTDDKNVDIYEVRGEKQNPRCLKQDSSELDQQLFSPLASPSNSTATRKVECLECVTDLTERSSPVSVLESIFTDDIISPASNRSYSGKTSIQPRRIQFEEQDSLPTNQSNRFKTCMDDKKSIYEQIKAVIQASTFSWDELYIRSLSSDLLIDPLLLDKFEYLPNLLCQDQKILFDCINEVLVEVCGYYLGSLGVSSVKPNIRPLPDMKNTIQEVSKGVYWHFLQMPVPRTLDLIIRKDLAKSGTWMDLQHDIGSIGVEIGDAIFEDLVEDAITSCMNESWECEYNVLPA